VKAHGTSSLLALPGVRGVPRGRRRRRPFQIGETGNRAVLTKDEWNVLVQLIRAGQLTDL
jgi:hypothetical protein